MFSKVSRVNQVLTTLFYDWLSLILVVCILALKLIQSKAIFVGIHDRRHLIATLLKQCPLTNATLGYVTEEMLVMEMLLKEHEDSMCAT